jgi:DNA replication protein DnaC
VAFYRAADLTQELLEQHRAGTAGRLMKRIARADLFILDEVGYMPFSKQASQLLFSTVASGYEQQSLIVTSNLEFGRWNEVFGNDRLTAALVDRLVHHAHILAFTGDSYRLRQAMARRSEGESPEVKSERANNTDYTD